MFLFFFRVRQKMFNLCARSQLLLSFAAFLCTLSAQNVHGLKCRREYKPESSDHTQIMDPLCPRETLPYCYFLNCTNGYKTRTDWGCDGGSAPGLCSKPFESDGFWCVCKIGDKGVDMSNEHMRAEIDNATTISPPSTQSTSTTATSVPPTSSTENKPPHVSTLSLANRRCIIHFKTFIMPILLAFVIGAGHCDV